MADLFDELAATQPAQAGGDLFDELEARPSAKSEIPYTPIPGVRSYDEQGVGVPQATRRGYADLASGLGSIAGYAGERFDSALLRDQGAAMRDYWSDVAADNPMSPQAQTSPFDDPGVLADPTWYSENVARMAPSFVGPLGVAGAVGKGTLAALPGYQRLATLFGATAGGGFGGALEGAQTYEEGLARGEDEPTAARAGEAMAAGTAALNALPLYKILNPSARGVIYNFLSRGLTEGVTEAMEEPLDEIIQGLAYDKPTDWEDVARRAAHVAPGAFLLGGLAGGGNVQAPSRRGPDQGEPAPARTPDLLDEAEAVQAQPQPAVDPLTEAIQAAAVQPQQAPPVQPEPAQPVQPPQAAPVAPETATTPPASQAHAPPQQAAPVVPGPVPDVQTPPSQPPVPPSQPPVPPSQAPQPPTQTARPVGPTDAPSPPAPVPPREGRTASDAFSDFMERTARRLAMEDQGQQILDDMENSGVSPTAVTQEFWERTYPQLNERARQRFERMVERLTGWQPGTVIATSPQGDIVARDWEEVGRQSIDAPRADNLEGTERGYVALMRWANQQRDQFTGPVSQSQPAQPVEAQSLPAQAAPTPAGPSVPGDAVTVFTPDNQPVEARYEVVEPEDLIASHTPEGRPNPAFPADRQPRQRERAASQTQIQSIARSLNPALLEQSPTTDTGAPIVDAQNIVESGNGRVAAIQLAAREGNTQGLKDYLQQNAERFGIDPQAVAGMRNPVLVRRRTTELDERGQQEFARASNVSGMARFSPAEQAELDAERLTEDDLALFESGEDGNVLARSNDAFVKRFMERAGSADAAAMRDPQGRPNREAVARIQAAMFQKAYGDRDLVQLAAEDADPDVRNILNGLQRAAPAFARARGIDAEEAGEISDNIVRAIQLFRDAKHARQDVDEYLAQQGLFEAESAEAAKIASFIAANTRSAKTLGDAFEEMATLLETELVRAQNLSMFDGLEIQPGEIISHGIETAQQRRAERSGAGPQQSIFETREEPGPEPAPGGRGEGQQGQDQRRAGSGVSGAVSQLDPAPFEVSYDGEASQIRERGVPAGEPGPDVFAPSPVQLDIFTPRQEAAPAQSQPARAKRPLVRNARTGTFAIGIDRITSAADAAHVLAPIRKSAQENFVTLVVDRDGRPLEIQRMHIGTTDGASVAPFLVLGNALNVEGAHTLWFAHNHPSGSTIQSAADNALTAKLSEGARILGLIPAGMVVVGPGNRSFTYHRAGEPATTRPLEESGIVESPVRTAARSRGAVPVTERRLTRIPSPERDALTSPDKARDYVNRNFGGASVEGVLYLNTKHQPIELVEIPGITGLDDQALARELVGPGERLNAAAAIVLTRGAGDRRGFAQRLDRAKDVASGDLRILDIMDHDGSGFTSLLEAGISVGEGRAGFAVREGPADEGGEPGRVTPQRPGDNERGFITRHPLNDIEQAQRKRYARIERSMVSKLSKIGMARDVPDAYRIMLRRFRAAVQKGAREAEAIIKQRDQLSAEHRRLISDYLEGELQQGVVPPENVKAYAAMMQEAIASQTEELIRLGMLSRETANRWRGRYLTRYYLKTDKPIPKALRRQFNKVDGHFLKGRGMFEMVQKRDIENWKKLGWEIRDPQSDTQEVINNLRDNDKVLMWRDYTPAERQRMGEIRDAVYRFARGHMETARDIAIGRLFKAIAESDFASPRQTHEDQVQVPNTEIPGTGGVKRYGALAGRWVHKDIWNDLEAIKDPDIGGGEVWRQYMRGLSFWKEGKTALNPVVHSNNVWSSWIMADLYGISPWDVKAYREALKDYTGKGPFYQEAIDNGLFGTEFYGTEIRQVASELANFESMEKAAAGKLRRMIDYGARFSGARKYRNAMGRLYRAEDQFFKLLIYKDMREKGATIDEAIDEAERWIFNYMDLPKGARMIKNSPVGLPFFSYTYKAVPALTYAAVTAPWRFAKWIALFGGFNYIAFAALFGPDHEEKEEEERRVMPDYMKGLTPFLVQKHIRWPFDRRPGVATYLGLERRFPMGDLFDINNQLGGVGILQPLMPNNPVFTTATALVFGKDSFTGRDIANDAESAKTKISKYMGWLYYQYMPNTPMLPFSYSFDKVMNGVAHEMGEPVEVIPTVKEYTGRNFHGEEQTLARAFGSTVFGFKIREFDVDRQTARMNRELQGKIRDLKFQIRGAARDQSLTEGLRQRRIQDLRKQIDTLVREHREERN